VQWLALVLFSPIFYDHSRLSSQNGKDGREDDWPFLENPNEATGDIGILLGRVQHFSARLVNLSTTYSHLRQCILQAQIDVIRRPSIALKLRIDVAFR
jgi:hypothetical protein